MLPPDVGSQKNHSRTVLLATDNRNSVIAEVVDGKTNQMVYSAFGYLSAEQEVTTRLGFNGELREAQSCWYLLGNGYRAYNPRLMRFHSPDSWSPFGRGGLNPYMYCVGDPVNRSDPTGHSPLFPGLPIGLRKFVSRSGRFLFGGSGVTGPSRRRALNATADIEDLASPMRPEDDGFLPAIGRTSIFVGMAPAPQGNNSPRFTSVEPDRRTYPGYAAGAIASGSSSSGWSGSRSGSSRAVNRQSSRRNSSSGVGDPPPRYENPPDYDEAMQYWDADTFAASQPSQIFVVNRVSDLRSQYGSLHPPPLEHRAPPPPPPPPPRSRSPSPPTSRDSTPPRSRNPSGGNNAPNLSGLGPALRFIRRR